MRFVRAVPGDGVAVSDSNPCHAIWEQSVNNLRPYEGITPNIDPTARIDPTALVIGDVTIGPQSSLWPYVVARGDVNRIRIGSLTNIQDHAMLHVSHVGPFNPKGAALTIGDSVTIGHHATLHGCTVGDYCLIGIGAILMDDVVVEDEVMIGAGALVPPGKVLQSGYLYVGSPAKQSRALTDREREYLRYSAEHYAQMAERHAKSNGTD